MQGTIPALIFALSVQAVEFNRDIRPILSDKCFACHGPDAKAKGIPLRLDQEAAAKNGRAIVPGKPDESEVLKRILAEKPARRMPPAFTGHTVSEREVALLKQWIEEGAPWQAHWAFIAPRKSALPTGDRNPIDSFVRVRLAAEGLKPAPPATKEAQLRRVAFDLTGLPPSIDELDAFLKDTAPNAYEKALDRLLASPRYGERMAARWLDAARYADTNGYQFDGARDMWRWRDWVIGAFNRNLPYNQFLIEQLAGDLLPNATLDQIIATGFNRNHRGNTEDGIIPEEYAVEYVADRVETTSTVFLGLTLGCARCHNHKYDPLLQKDFYSMFAYFNNVPENGRAMKYGNSPPYVQAPTADQARELARLDSAIAAQRQILAKIQTPAASSARWTPQSGMIFSHAEGAKGEYPGRFDIRDPFTFHAHLETGAKAHGAVLSRMQNTPRGRGYGIYLRDGRVHVHITNNYADDAIRVDTEPLLKPNSTYHVTVTYDGSVAAAGVRIYIDGRNTPFKIDRDTLYRPFVNAGGKFAYGIQIGVGGGPGNEFQGRILSASGYERVLPEREAAALAGSIAFGREAYFEHQATGPVAAAWKTMRALELERAKFAHGLPTVMVMSEAAPKQSHILDRGAYDKPGARVDPAIPEVLGKLPPGTANNRLGLARWMTSAENPLTARVMVNRVWQMHFGTGLVKTAEDFGTQGEWPSHPELLDWLAVDFRESGWDVKRLHRLIVTSETYRQASRATPDLLQRDPENRLLARGPRSRIAAEMVRDNALAAAGLLRHRLGGPSVKPYQPASLWKDVIMQDMDYVESTGDDLYRRSLYTFWKRTVAPPMMANFDAANHESCTVRETRTNTPLQALNLMNDVTFLESARAIGERMLGEGGATPPSRLTLGFRLLTSRRPTAGELEILTANLAHHLDLFATDPKAAADYLKQGRRPADARFPAPELAAYSAVASLMMNLDEAVNK